MTHALPAGNSEVTGETDTHKNTQSRETVIRAKKGVREEEIHFPWRDPRKHCHICLLWLTVEYLGCGRTFARGYFMAENTWNCIQSLQTVTLPTNTHLKSQIGVAVLSAKVCTGTLALCI